MLFVKNICRLIFVRLPRLGLPPGKFIGALLVELNDMRGSKPVILFATPILHHPPLGGPALRIENSIKALSQIADLFIYSRVPLEDLGGELSLSFYKQYCKEFYFAPFLRPSTNRYIVFTKRAVNFFTKRTINRAIFDRIGEAKKENYRSLLRIAGRIHADAIWLGYGNISYPVLEYIKRHSTYKVVVDTDSVWSRFILRALPYAKSARERHMIEETGREKEGEEAWGTQLADITTAVSQVDAEYYVKLAKHPQQVHIFPNVIDASLYENRPAPADNLRHPSVYLAGTFAPRSPMDDAARWVVGEVLPLVRAQIPDIHFYIVGSGSDLTLPDIKDPGITVIGQLPSVLPYLCHVNVALVPLRFESGTRFKILEAAACGIPVVSTTLGAEGIPVAHQKDILIADDSESFAHSIVRLIRNRDFAHEMAKNLRKLVHQKYSVARLVQEGCLILDDLLVAHNVPPKMDYPIS